MLTVNGSCNQQRLHFVFLPYPAPGHMIPMLDVARALCSERGASGTFVTTPRNADFVHPAIKYYTESLGLDIDLILVPFSGTDFGLPEGVENHADLPPGTEHLASFARAIMGLEKLLGDVVRDCRPDCIVADVYITCATSIAQEHGIPRLVFQWSGLFTLSVMNELASLYDQMPEKVEEGMVVPRLPHQVTVTRWQLPETFRFPGVLPLLMQSEWSSFGVIFNSFHELEPKYAEHYLAQADTGRKVYCIGPVSMGPKLAGEAAGIVTNSNREGHHRLLQWLDSKAPGSVLYVSFGTLSKLKGEQLRELATGLVTSGHIFIWVVASKTSSCDWMPDGFEDRIEREGKGVVVKDLAPQREILNHRSVGGFLTHCGWNSITEGLAAGVPMATWPQQYDQFLNEKLVVEILRVGTAVREGWKGNTDWVEEELVTAVEVTAAVRRLMGTQDESLGMKARAKVLAENARAAVADGGSSHNDVARLLEDVRAYRAGEIERGLLQTHFRTPNGPSSI